MEATKRLALLSIVHPPSHICHQYSLLFSPTTFNAQHFLSPLSSLLYLALKYIFGYLDICSVEV